MIYLNLLSPQKKQNLEQSFIFAILGNMAEITLIIIILSSIILLGAKVMLQNNFEVIIAQSALINREFGEINQDIRKLNRELKDIDQVQTEYVFWSRFLTEFSKTVPPGIRLADLSTNQDDNTFTINGYAAERANFLEFKKNLGNFPYLKNLESPIANLLLPRNANFTFSASLNFPKP